MLINFQFCVKPLIRLTLEFYRTIAKSQYSSKIMEYLDLWLLEKIESQKLIVQYLWLLFQITKITNTVILIKCLYSNRLVWIKSNWYSYKNRISNKSFEPTQMGMKPKQTYDVNICPNAFNTKILKTYRTTWAMIFECLILDLLCFSLLYLKIIIFGIIEKITEIQMYK